MNNDIQIELRPITRDNWQKAIKLDVCDDQRTFVASNLYSIAESKFHPELAPLGVYHGDEMVGFTMHGYDDEAKEWWIIRLMIDAAHQGRGYGRAAMQEVIRLISEQPDCAAILVSFEPDNYVAEKLYLSLGFEHTGRVEDRETVVRLRVR